MRGRKPKSASRQIVDGDPSKRGVHKLEARLEAEPKPARGLPPCPPHLPGLAQKAWAFWCEELEAMGVGAKADGLLLEGAAVAYAAYWKIHPPTDEQGARV